MFPGKPQEKVGVNPRVKPKRFRDLRDFSVECITHKHASKKGGLTGLYHCRNTNYYHAFHHYIVWLFLPNQNTTPSNFWQWIPRTFWLYPSKQAVDRFILFTQLWCVQFSHLERSVEPVLAADPSGHTVVVLADY